MQILINSRCNIVFDEFFSHTAKITFVLNVFPTFALRQNHQSYSTFAFITLLDH